MEHNAETVGAGIDVSKAKLDIALLGRQGETSHFVVPNDEGGVRKIAKRLSGFAGKVVMESTGRYHLLSALRLSGAGLDVRVLNPLVSHRYMQAGIRKNKTDKADAGKLAEIAVIEKRLPEPFSPDVGTVRIRQKIGLIASLETQVQTLKAIMGGYRDFQETLGTERSVAEKALAEAVALLDAAREKLEREIGSEAPKGRERDGRRAILASVPGISEYAAALMLQFFGEGYDKSAKQWIAYAGMDVSVRQSGTWHGKGRLSKRGNAYLRKRLFCAAWGATMHSERFRGYYNELKGKGRGHVEALVIIARKLIRIGFTLLKNNEHYDEKSCFSF
jgi:transposase